MGIMSSGSWPYFVCLVLAHTAFADIGLHSAAHKSHLLVAPSFAGDAIELHPGLHPDHDLTDFAHLIPAHTVDLHWSQEGHRPALHGAKHAHMKTTFKHPTVVLEHSNHVDSVECADNFLSACFASPEAMSTVERSWTADGMHTLNLVTYHQGCGDPSGRKRTFFEATDPIFNLETSCVTAAVKPVSEQEMIHGGDLKWNTHTSHSARRRSSDPVKGHVRVSAPPMVDMPGDTVDLTQNETAFMNFFETEIVNSAGAHVGVEAAGLVPTGQDYMTDDLDFLPVDGNIETRSLNTVQKRTLETRGILDWIEKGIRWFVDKLVSIFKDVTNKITEFVEAIANLAEAVVDLVGVLFGGEFKRTFHEDLSRTKFLEGSISNKDPVLSDVGPHYKLAKKGLFYTFECTKCGFDIQMSFNGELSFSLQGITKGEVSLVNTNSSIYAIFGITLETEHTKGKQVTELREQLLGIPLSPFTIPGIFTLGPQVSISASMSLSVAGKLELLIGGSLSIGNGTARLSLVDSSRNELSGFHPEFNEVAEAKSGSVSATAALGLPVAVEVGLDLLNGKFKKSVGIIDEPSVYISAEFSSGEDKSCNNGLELRFGAKNHLYASVFDIYTKSLNEMTLFETGPTCITASGFKSTPVPANQSVFDIVNGTKAASAVAASIPSLSNVAARIQSALKDKAGFRIIQDAGETSLLVSGTDGFIYLVSKTVNYDISAPWGSVQIDSGIVGFDVFGRLMGFMHDEWQDTKKGVYGSAFPLRVFNQTTAPKTAKVASLSSLTAQGKDLDAYGASISMEVLTSFHGKKIDSGFYYPTFCEVKKGKGKQAMLRLYLTRCLIKAEGQIVVPRGQKYPDSVRKQTRDAFRNFGVKNIKNCRTIRLTSKLTGKQKQAQVQDR